MIGERLKELRKLNNLSQEQVAKELNITRQAISKWETDKTMPDIENIILLSKLYNVSLESIMGEEEEKNRACEKTKVFSCVLFLINTTVIIFHKKAYNPPSPMRMPL